jgi:hypothetical protein
MESPITNDNQNKPILFTEFGIEPKKGGAIMESSLNLTTVRPQHFIWGQTETIARKSNLRRYLLIGGGIITVPIILSISVTSWIVKQNWTMLPL